MVNYTENYLICYLIKPDIPIDIALVSNDLKALTPVALALKHMIVELAKNLKK